MDTFVTLANWRTAPYSLQSFHNVDKLIPVSRIEGPAQARQFAAELQSLESLVFEDQHGQKRQLPQVLDDNRHPGPWSYFRAGGLSLNSIARVTMGKPLIFCFR